MTTLLAHFVANDRVARAIAGIPGVEVNTDDRNIVEFGFARSVGRPRALIVPELRHLAESINASRPSLDAADAVNWPAVETARVGLDAINGFFDDLPANPPPAEKIRQQALVRFYRSNDATGAYELWNQQTEGPRDLVESRLVAAIEAERGSEAAMPWIARIREFEPGEADTLLATLRFKQRRFGEAADALGSALASFKTDPWPTQKAMMGALELAEPIVIDLPSAAQGLFDRLRDPFVVHAVDDARILTATALARHINFAALCRGPIGSLEPHVPWTRYLLTVRRDCYEAANDPRMDTAARELAAFYAREPIPLAPAR